MLMQSEIFVFVLSTSQISDQQKTAPKCVSVELTQLTAISSFLKYHHGLPDVSSVFLAHEIFDTIITNYYSWLLYHNIRYSHTTHFA